MGKQPGSELAKLEDFDTSKYIVLHPVITMAQGADSADLIESLSVVQINPKADAGDVYHDFRFANERDGKAALTALGLGKIAAAAGIQWDPGLTRMHRERRADGHVYVAYQAAGRVRQPNGEFYVEIQSADIDTADVEEQARDTYQRKLDAGRARYKAEEIPDMVRRDVLQMKQFALRHAETKAKNRVIRRLLSLRQTYEQKDLQKPFVVPRLLYRPDLVLALEQGSRATEELYGQAPSLLTRGLPATSAQAPSPAGSGEPVVEATGQTEPRAQDLAPKDEATTAGPELKEPSGDPVFEDGPHKGERFSEVADTDPKYLEFLANDRRQTKTVQKLAREWLDWSQPSQQQLGS